MITLILILASLIVIGAIVAFGAAITVLSPVLLIILFLPLTDLVIIKICKEIKISREKKKEE